MLVELKPRGYQATLYMQAGNRLTQTTTGEGGTPNPTEQTGKSKQARQLSKLKLFNTRFVLKTFPLVVSLCCS